MYERYLANELNEILNNFDNIYKSALKNIEPLLDMKLARSSDKRKIIDNFLNEEKYINLRKSALKG